MKTFKITYQINAYADEHTNEIKADSKSEALIMWMARRGGACKMLDIIELNDQLVKPIRVTEAWLSLVDKESNAGLIHVPYLRHTKMIDITKLVDCNLDSCDAIDNHIKAVGKLLESLFDAKRKHCAR